MVLVYKALGDKDNAEALCYEAHMLLAGSLGDHHPSTVQMELLRRALRDWAEGAEGGGRGGGGGPQPSQRKRGARRARGAKGVKLGLGRAVLEEEGGEGGRVVGPAGLDASSSSDSDGGSDGGGGSEGGLDAHADSDADDDDMSHTSVEDMAFRTRARRDSGVDGSDSSDDALMNLLQGADQGGSGSGSGRDSEDEGFAVAALLAKHA
jgi:hypothetical protein